MIHPKRTIVLFAALAIAMFAVSRWCGGVLTQGAAARSQSEQNLKQCRVLAAGIAELRKRPTVAGTPAQRVADLARQIEIPLFERPPAALEEFVAAGVDVAPRRHAGSGADVAMVEDGAALDEAVHIGRGHGPVGGFGAPALIQRFAAAVGADVVAAQGVAEYDDDVHNCFLSRGCRAV